MTVHLDYRPRLADLTFLSQEEALRDIPGIEAEASRGPRRTRPDEFDDRKGYNSDFLGFTVPFPKPSPFLKKKILPVAGTEFNQLDYEHFSVVMNRERRLAAFVAVNIAGDQFDPLERGNDKWFLDGRIPDDAQVGEELYSDNILDRACKAAGSSMGFNG